jgi:hypothetical protein
VDAVLVDVSVPGCDGCGVHEGFFNTYQSVAAEVQENLAYVMSKAPTADLWITGATAHRGCGTWGAA